MPAQKRTVFITIVLRRINDPIPSANEKVFFPKVDIPDFAAIQRAGILISESTLKPFFLRKFKIN